ncbi:MAG: NUDIX domain-containing protein [Planctomycetota bacterium]
MTTLPELPYKLACLCDLRDADGRVLLLRRKRSPNKGLCSPIGGKLETSIGESPTACAQREIMEEAGIEIPIERIRLLGIISEAGFEGTGHWLLFYFRVMGPVEIEPHEMDEGWLEWHAPEDIEALPLPETDREIIWPLVREHEHAGADGGPGFFAVHVDCTGEKLVWEVQQGHPGRGG